MSQFQKVIKYLAFAFSVFLIVTIIQYSAYFLDFLAPMLGLEHSSDNQKVEEVMTLDSQQISSLDIDLVGADVEIKQGDRFIIKTNNKNISCKQDKQKLKVEEKKFRFGKTSGKIIMTIPKDVVLDKISIDAGAGQVKIDQIQANTGDFDLGAGRFSIHEINILNDLEMDSGAGKVTIENGTIHHLNLELGVGKAEICCVLSGRNEINAGVGALELTLLKGNGRYRYQIEKGIGSISYNGESIDSSSFGNGQHFIDIEGGVGSINIEEK